MGDQAGSVVSIEERRRRGPKEQFYEEAERDLGNRPQIIITDRWMRQISTEALLALQEANEPPVLFRRGTEIVRVTGGAAPLAEPLTVAALRGRLDRVADFVRLDDKGAHPARPPQDVVQDILSLPETDIPLPELRAIRNHPIFLADGRLLARDGYDPDSGVLLRVRGLRRVRDDMPLAEARSLLLDELLVDFPFREASSRAHAVLLILEPFVRELIAGATPLYLIDAPAQGTGKGLLSEVSVLVATGDRPAVMSVTDDEDETEKRITSLLLAGHGHILLDNVTQLRSRHLAAVLTTTAWAGRRLGRSEIVRVPNEATWLATGNNVELSHELTRRVIPIRLDAGMERPEERDGFKHELPEWAEEHREELVSACLSIVRAWIKAGRPSGEGTLGRFESWVKVMGGLLDVMGLPGFLANRQELRASADMETREWQAALELWWAAYGDSPITAADLHFVLKENKLLLDLWGGRVALGAQQRIGHALKIRRDRVFGRFAIRSAGLDGATRSAAYRLELVEKQGSPKTHETPETTRKAHGEPPAASGFVSGFSPPAAKNPGKNPGNENGSTSASAGVSGVSGVFHPPHTSGELTEAARKIIETPPDRPCGLCGGRDFWREPEPGKPWRCARCHPPHRDDVETYSLGGDSV